LYGWAGSGDKGPPNRGPPSGVIVKSGRAVGRGGGLGDGIRNGFEGQRNAFGGCFHSFRFGGGGGGWVQGGLFPGGWVHAFGVKFFRPTKWGPMGGTTPALGSFCLRILRVYGGAKKTLGYNFHAPLGPRPHSTRPQGAGAREFARRGGRLRSAENCFHPKLRILIRENAAVSRGLFGGGNLGQKASTLWNFFQSP